VSPVENSDEILADAYTASVLTQLEIEMTAARTNVKQIAGQLGGDYNTLRRYVRGERDMPLPVLLKVLILLKVDSSTFFLRAAERMPK